MNNLRLLWLALLTLAAAATTGGAQAPPAPLPVTRIDGRAGAEAPLPPQAQPPPRPGAPQAPLPPMPVTQLDERRAGELDAGPLTLQISEPRPVTEVLLLLIRDTGFSLVPDADVAGTFIGELNGVTLREALTLALHPLGLDFSVSGTAIRVFKRRTETRLFDVNYVSTRRTARRATGGPTSVGGDERGAAVVSSDDGDLYDELRSGVRMLLSDEGRFTVDPQAAMLQVTDYPERLDRVGLYLEATQVRVSRQVRLEAHVLEVQLAAESGGAIDWERALGSAPPPVVPQAPSPRGLRIMGARLPDLAALIAALGQQGTVRLLGSPQVVAMNNQPALMRIGTEEVYFVTTSHVDQATGRAQQVVSPQSVTEGITLSVTAQISADGFIHMSVAPSITERTGEAKSRFGDLVPILSVREADTAVRVLEGETVVFAGLLQGRTETRPSPGFAGLFGAREQQRALTETVILLTPRIVVAGRS
jgi:MSHA biogenesis protein MshL